MATGTHMTTRPTRTHAWTPRAPRATRTTTRGERSAGEHHPRRTVRANRPRWPVRAERAVMVVAIRLTVVGELDAGEEYDRQHEHDAGHDHHPRRDAVKAGVLGRGRVYRQGWPRGRLNRSFGCLGHVSIMPRQSPADNQLRT